MIQNYVRWRILQEFFNYPRKEFHIRELCRRVKLGQPSVTNHINALLKEGFLLKERKDIYPTIKAHRDDEQFKRYKRFNTILQLQKTGLMDSLYDQTMPDVIVLFGSASKGEDVEESDIDIFLQAKEKKLGLEKYEKLLNRKISLFFEENFSKLNPELKNNILNGIIIKGYLKVF